MILHEVADHEHDALLVGEPDQLGRVLRTERQWLLDETVLARLNNPLRDGVVARGRGCYDDRVEREVGQHEIQIVGGIDVRIEPLDLG